MSETGSEGTWAFFAHAPLRIKMRLVLVALSGVTVISLSGWAIYELARVQHFTHQRQPAAAKVVPEPEPAKALAHTYVLRDLALPLSDRDRRRSGYVQFSLALDCPSEEARHWMELNRAKLISTIVETGNRFTFEDLEGPDGIQRFKKSILSAYSDEFRQLAPTALEIEDWVIN